MQRMRFKYLSPYSASRRGFTLTEMAIVVGIIGLVLGGIWAASAAAYSVLRVNRAHEEIDTIINNMRQLYASSPTIPPGDLTGSAMTAGVFPADMVTPDGLIANPWGAGPEGVGGISVGAGGGWGGCLMGLPNGFPPNMFQIVLWKMANIDEIQFLSAYIGGANGDVVCLYADCTNLQNMQPVNIKTTDITPCTNANNDGDPFSNVVLTVQK